MRADHKVSRVAVVVPDVDAAAKDFAEMFGIEFVFVDEPELKIRLGLSDVGLILVANLDQNDPSILARQWAGGVVASIGFNVSNLEAMRERLAEKGCFPLYRVEAPGGMNDYTMDAGFHGIPLAIYSYKEESRGNSPGPDEIPPEEYKARLVWFKRPG